MPFRSPESGCFRRGIEGRVLSAFSDLPHRRKKGKREELVGAKPPPPPLSLPRIPRRFPDGWTEHDKTKKPRGFFFPFFSCAGIFSFPFSCPRVAGRMSFLLPLSQSAKWTVWGMGFGPLPPSLLHFPFRSSVARGGNGEGEGIAQRFRNFSSSAPVIS